MRDSKSSRVTAIMPSLVLSSRWDKNLPKQISVRKLSAFTAVESKILLTPSSYNKSIDKIIKRTIRIWLAVVKL